MDQQPRVSVDWRFPKSVILLTEQHEVFNPGTGPPEASGASVPSQAFNPGTGLKAFNPGTGLIRGLRGLRGLRLTGLRVRGLRK